MSPTVFREDGYRFYFFSREEPRMHVHVHCADGEAKFWLDPIRIQSNRGFSRTEINRIQKLVEEHQEQLLAGWHDFFND